MSVGFLIAFGLLAVVAVASAWRMIFSRHPIHSALCLVLTLCATAGIYLLLGAPFIAMVQVAVYAGAIMVLFLFIIMYLNLGLAPDIGDGRPRRLTAYATVGLLGLLLVAGGVASWTGAVAGTSPEELKAARQALGEGKASVPGKPAGTPEAFDRQQVARAYETPRASTVEEIGLLLFSRYALPFEVASLLLLVAMIGALVIARPQLTGEAAGKEAGV